MLVQLGDILDRGEDEIAILSLLRSLDVQARAQGGAVFQVCAEIYEKSNSKIKIVLEFDDSRCRVSYYFCCVTAQSGYPGEWESRDYECGRGFQIC